MRTRTKTFELVLAGMLVGVGILIPFITGHAFGIQGTVLLPMHFSVLISGFMLGPVWGLAVGIVTPIISSVLTGMPAFYPMLPVMICELGVYGLMTGWLYQRKRRGIFTSLIISMILGRLVHAAVFALLLSWQGAAVTLSVLTFLVQGIPGTILQLIIVPLIVRAAARSGYICRREETVRSPEEFSGEPEEESALAENTEGAPVPELFPDIVNEQIARIRRDEISVAVIRDGRVVYTDRGRGPNPMIKIMDENPQILKDAVVVDKIIGKAAAMMLILGGAREAYSCVLSRAGNTYLEGYGFPVHSELCIDVIENSRKDGICPFEKTVIDIEDPQEGYEAMKNTQVRLRIGA